MRRVIVGLFALIGFFVVLAAAGGWAVWHFALKPRGGGTPVTAASLLTLDLTSNLPEATPNDPFAELLFESKPTLRKVLDGIERAAGDPRIKGLFARVGGEELGLAKVQELRQAVLAFRQSGKPAVAFADSFGEVGSGSRGYYLATAFDEIWLQPMGLVGVAGVRAESPFFRGTFDKIGIEPLLDHRREYKTAMNMITETGMTPAHREMTEALLRSIWGQLSRDVAKARKLDEAEVAGILGAGPYLDQEALKLRLIDRIGYRDEALGALTQKTGGKAVRLGPYLDEAGPPNATGARIALIVGTGAIQRGQSESNPVTGGGFMGADTVARAFRMAADDPEVRAILFRVDSPGGSAVASETIWRETVRAKARGKPVIVSMGDVAGSGGYYIAAAADKIVAHPATLTGSIGVVAGKVKMTEFWEKLGVSWGAVEIGKNAGMFSTLEGYTPEQRERFESELDAIYAGFKQRVAQGRRMHEDRVESLAKGRVWTGEAAQASGLADALGGYPEAIRLAREAAGLAADAPIELKRYPPEEGATEMLLSKLLGREREDEQARAPEARVLSWLRPWLTYLEASSAGALAMSPLEVR